MIEEKFYTQEEGRDSSIYLGIDEKYIPFDLFKGVYFEDGLVFTDDAFFGVQFVVNVEERGVSIVTLDRNQYVIEEDIMSTDKWLKIGHALGEYTTYGTIFGGIESQPSPNDIAHKKLLERYYNGEKGFLDESSKIYDDEGLYYMWNFNSFQTKIKGESLQDRIRRHVDFVGGSDRHWTAQRFEIHTNRKLWYKFLDAIIITPEIVSGITDDPDLCFRITSISDRRYGDITFIEDDYNDFTIKLIVD